MINNNNNEREKDVQTNTDKWERLVNGLIETKTRAIEENKEGSNAVDLVIALNKYKEKTEQTEVSVGNVAQRVIDLETALESYRKKTEPIRQKKTNFDLNPEYIIDKDYKKFTAKSGIPNGEGNRGDNGSNDNNDIWFESIKDYGSIDELPILKMVMIFVLIAGTMRNQILLLWIKSFLANEIFQKYLYFCLKSFMPLVIIQKIWPDFLQNMTFKYSENIFERYILDKQEVEIKNRRKLSKVDRFIKMINKDDK